MKTATFLIFLSLPISVFTQRGYCPCMDKNNKNDGLDLVEVLNAINDEMIDLNTRPTSAPPVQAVFVDYRPEPPASPPPTEMQQIQQVQTVQQPALVPPVQEQLNSANRVRSERSQRSFAQKKKRKIKRVRLRGRKKAKKYRGGCPVFKY